MHSHHGVYGSNVRQWSSDDIEKLGIGKFKWVVVRLDSDPELAKSLKAKGLQVILQAPGCFNEHMPDPGGQATMLWEKALSFMDATGLICLDNEPNLYLARASLWWAEQWTRWYRALVAHFRYLDSYTCHWKILHPAFVSHKEHNFETWLEVGKENMLESEGLSAHCYWQTLGAIDEREFGGSWRVYREHYPKQKLFITEYSPDIGDMNAIGRASEMVRYLELVKEKVECACYFILGGTQDWEKYHLPKETALEVGKIIKQ